MVVEEGFYKCDYCGESSTGEYNEETGNHTSCQDKAKLTRVIAAARNIYKVTSMAFMKSNPVLCPHGNWPQYPTHAWWCDKCWFELRDALDALEEE